MSPYYPAIPISSIITVWEAEYDPASGDSQTGIKLFTTDISDNKWHLRVLGENDKYHIERYNNQSDKLQPATGGSGVCHHGGHSCKQHNNCMRSRV